MKYSNSGYIEVSKKEPDYESLKPYLVTCKCYQKIFKLIMQYARTYAFTIFKKNFKSPFLAFNVKNQYESVTIDTICSNAPTINDSSMHKSLLV